MRRKLNGTPGNTVARSRSISSSARWRLSRNGCGSSRITSVAPDDGGAEDAGAHAVGVEEGDRAEDPVLAG